MIRFIVALLFLDVLLALPVQMAAHPRPQAVFAIELPVVLALLWLSPLGLRRALVILATILVMLALLLRVANTGIAIAFNRPFDPASDVALIPAGWDLVVRSYGGLVAVGGVVLVLIALGASALAVGAAIHLVGQPPARVRFGTVCAIILAIVLSVVPARGVSFVTASLLGTGARAIVSGAEAAQAFRAQLASDPLAGIGDNRLYAALRDHDVLVVFVESYGRVAVDSPLYAAIGAQLDAMTQELRAAGFGARSAWMLSPTFGGISWLAHSTLMDGVWVDSQRRFATLLKSHHPTMLQDFHRAGWRTLAVMPEITGDWPEGRYFAPDRIYDAPALDFAGKPFGYITMPDQFTLAALESRELSTAARPPVMAVMALVSSHAPWTPLPKLVSWSDVGSGAIFDFAREGDSPQKVWADPEAVRVQYGRSIAYTLASLESFVLTYGNDRTVMIVLGDHQPMGLVTGPIGGHDVPVHLIARDPAVLAALADWHWTEGMRPDAGSPEWRMDTLRERLARTFSGG